MRNNYEARITELEAQLAAPSIPADVRDTMRRSLVASESINNTDGWYKRMTAALAWLDATQ